MGTFGLALATSAPAVAGPAESVEGSKPSIGELVAAGRLDALEKKIRSGLSPDAGLMAAARNNSTAALSLLLELGANPGGLHASRALFAALAAGQADVAALLTEAGTDLEGADATGRTLLIFTVGKGHADRLRAVLDAGVDVDRPTHTGITALMTAVTAGELKKVRLLLLRGADIEARDRDGWTALSWAVRRANADAVRMLLARGADPNTEDRLGWSPLHLAASQGDAEIVHALLVGGASPNHVTASAGTPLIRAVLNGDVGTVNQLLAFGANLWTTFGGRSPLMWARELGRPQVIRALRAPRSDS